MVKLPISLKFTAGVVACAFEPFKYKDFTPSSSTYLAPRSRLFKEQRTAAYFAGILRTVRQKTSSCLYKLCIAGHEREQAQMNEFISS